jgi:hypothetical protein
VTVRVTDSGQPPLSAVATFVVEVLWLPAFQCVTRNGGRVELSWPARAGLTYVVDYKDNLSAPVWTPLWTNVADGAVLRFVTPATAAPQRFFRLRVASETLPAP